MKISTTIIIVLAALTSATCLGQDGTTAYQFLDVTSSSHAYALGGHNVAMVDDDIQLVEQNPALLGPEYDHQVGLSYMRYIGSTNFMGARYGQGIDDHSAWGVGLQYFGYGTLTAADIDGTQTGTFSAHDMYFSGTYSHDIGGYFRGGVTLKYISSKYEDYSAGAIAADLGVNYYDPVHEVSFGLVFKNLGGQVKKFNDVKASLPWDIQVGYSQMFKSIPLRISVTAFNLRQLHSPYYAPADKNNAQSELVKKDGVLDNIFRHLVLGVEYLPSNNMYIGIGYNHKVRTDMSTYKRNFLSGFTIGGGLRVKAFGFGVAFAQPHTGATTLLFNVSTSIGELLR